MADPQEISFLNELKYDTQTNYAADVTGGAIATVADFGTSIYNSLVPEKYETSTQDILAKIDSNALRVYEENPDTIHTLSFIAGALVPAGLALKGLNAARSGMKGVNWFSEAGKLQSVKAVEAAFEAGTEATSAYRVAKLNYYGRALANSMTDAVAMEAALVGTMNAHPFMEDYNKDFVKNFVHGVALNPLSGAFHGIGLYLAKTEISAIEKGVAQTALAKIGIPEVASQTEVVMKGETLSLAATNVKKWQTLLQEDKDLTPYTKELLNTFITKENEFIAKKFEAMLSPEMRLMSQDTKDSLMAAIINSPEKFGGVESISFITTKDASIFGQAKGKLFKSPEDIQPGEVPFTYTNKAGNTATRKIVFSPEDNQFYLLSDQRSFARAVDMGETEASIAKGLDNGWHEAPRVDWSVENMGFGTARMDAEYLKALKYYDTLEAEKFKHIAIAPDDIPQLQGLFVRYQKMTAQEKAAVKLTLTENRANWDKIQVQAAARQGVTPEYLASLKNIERDFDTSYNFGKRADLGLWMEWIRGDGTTISKLRKAVDDLFRPGYGKTRGAEAERYRKAVEDLYQSSESKALRAQLASQADADGNIYLYRGINAKAFGHNSIDSYTTNPVKAGEHAKRGGNVQLYKVKVDEVLGAFRDLAGDSKSNNYEILVMSPTRETGVLLSEVKGMPSVEAIVQNNTAQATKQADVQTELFFTLVKAKDDAIKEGLRIGLPFKTIALRANVAEDTVKGMATGAFDTVLNSMSGIMKYDNAANLGQYLAPEKRALLLGTDINKVPFAQMRVQSATQNLLDLQKELLTDTMMRTRSSIVAEVRNSLLSKENQISQQFLEDNLLKVVNEAVGGKLFSSTDFALRGLGELGTHIANLGGQFTQLSNKIAEKFLKPFSNMATSLLKDRAALVEFNTAMAVEASIKGFKQWDAATGRFLVQDAAEPWIKVNGVKQRNMVPATYQGAEYVVMTPSVKQLLSHIQDVGREFYEMKLTQAEMRGAPIPNDIGFWRPAINPKDKEITYVIRKGDPNGTTMLFGKTKEELDAAITAWKSANPEWEKSFDLVSKDQQKAYNAIQGRHDPIFMSMADAGMLRTGSMAPAVVSGNADILSELANGYSHYIGYAVRNLIQDNYSHIFAQLDRLAGFKDAASRTAKTKGVLDGPTGATVIRNTLLGSSNLKEYAGWNTFQTGTQMIVEKALQDLQPVVNALTSPISGKIKGFFGKKTSDDEYMTLVADMAQRGIVSPWTQIAADVARAKYGVDNMAKIPGMTPRLFATANLLSSTLLLRFLELGQPIVNAISLPILMTGAIGRKYEQSFLNAKLSGDEQFSLMKTMVNGIRRMNDPQMKALFEDRAKAAGIFKPIVSEVNEVMAEIHSFNPDKLSRIEKAVDSKWMKKVFAKPADLSETIVRRTAFYTGIELASTKYPDLSNAGKMIFAKNFVEEVVGNYQTAMKPVIFQGTFGSAMGLFQTYMVTYAQSLFRQIEGRDWGSLAKMMGAQAGIFGTSSLPGFSYVSEYIGKTYSDRNIDLSTGTYRAANDKLADLILYGLPTQLGPGFTTRGDIAPRIPNIAGGLENLPQLNMLASAFQASNRIAEAAMHVDGNVTRSIGEALSLQNISRPIARMSEVFLTGHAITGTGREIAGPDEVRSFQGIAARIFATRSLQEVKARQALYLDSMYNAADREARQKVTARLKKHLRDEDLNPEIMDSLAEEYMRTGTPTGWRAAVNDAIGQTRTRDTSAVINYLNPRNSLMLMIDQMDGE